MTKNYKGNEQPGERKEKEKKEKCKKLIEV